MTDITTKLAEALRLISFASTDRGARETATEALRLYDAAKAQPVQESSQSDSLPPLPEPHWPRGYQGSVPSGGYTKDQMHDYARAAQAATPAPAPEPVAMVKLMERGGNAGIATVIHEIDNPMRERLRPGDKLYLDATPAPAPLTNAQFDRLYNNLPPSIQQDARSRLAFIRIGRAVEAAHGIGKEASNG